MKTDQLLQYIIANILVVHCKCLFDTDIYEEPYYGHFPTVQRPLPVWGCIQCSYANRALCCRYFQRCCTVGNFPNLATCLASDFAPFCSDKCTSDGQCPSGQKCCPPSNFVCLIPFGLNECPLTVPDTAILRPCNACFNNERCCPNPRTPGCCKSGIGSGPVPAQNPLTPG